jgi:hypothetical protein
MHDGGLQPAQQGNQVNEGQHVADGVNASSKRRHDDGLDAGQPFGFFRQQAAGTGHKDGTKSRTIQMRDGVQRHFLGSAQFEFRDDMADGLHKDA